MATSNWGTDRRLDESLFTSACEFEFFQAVRLLTLLREPREAGSAGPSANIVRFRAHNSLNFPASAIANLEPANGGPPAMEVNFLGMTGPRGALPVAYTEIAVDQECFGDRSFADFLDIFNHRLIELFFQVWRKHHFVVGYELSQRTKGPNDDFTSSLFDLIGMGTSGLRGRMAIKDLGLLRYAGLFAERPHSAEALRSFLSDYFGVRVEVEQFVGKWHALEPEEACELGTGDATSQLGGGAVAGDAVWNRESLVRIVLGPLTAEQFRNFLPDSPGFAEGVSLIRWFLGSTLDFEIQPTLRRDQVPPCRLGDESSATRLGWSAWLRTEPFWAHATDSVFREDEQAQGEA
jgi:type VI secretion system protein ImpH